MWRKVVLAVLLSGIVAHASDEAAMENAHVFYGYTFSAITHLCSFNESGDTLNINPYYGSDKHIEVKRLLLSNNNFWKSFTLMYPDTAVVKEYDNYTLITTPDGVTYSYLEISDSYALFVKSCDLPSYYVKKVMDNVRKQDT